VTDAWDSTWGPTLPLLLVYAAAGAAVATAHRRRNGQTSLLAILLWPFFLPGLLPDETPAGRVEGACAELAAALAALGPLPPLDDALVAVGAALHRLQDRAHEIQRLRAAWTAGSAAQLEARTELEAIGARTQEQLESGLDAVVELTARLHLARLSGEAPAGLEQQLRRLQMHVDSAREVDAFER